MKLLKFKKIEKDIEPEQKSKKKKWIILISILSVVIIAITLVAVYFNNADFKNFADRYILRRTVFENNLDKIELEPETNKTILAYDKEISILQKNLLTRYNSSGKETGQVKVEITNPIYDTKNKFLIIGEKQEKKLYLINGNDIKWEKEMEGSISRVAVNKNGYTAVVLANTTYKSIIVVFDINGKELFRTYLSSTIAVDIDLSNDNKYLAFAEVSTSGTFIQSNIKILSIEKAQKEPSDSFVYTYQAGTNSLVLDLEYQEKNKLTVIFDDAIYTIGDNEEKAMMTLDDKDKKIDFSGILLSNSVYRMIEKNTSFFKAATTVEIKNTNSGKESVYTVDGVAKNVSTNHEFIGINLGSEVYILNTNGWLLKKYTSEQEVKELIISDGLIGIVYRDKIELINV